MVAVDGETGHLVDACWGGGVSVGIDPRFRPLRRAPKEQPSPRSFSCPGVTLPSTSAT